MPKKQKSREQISGDGWAIWVSGGPFAQWEGEGDFSHIVKMVEEEFSPDTLYHSYYEMFVITHGTEFGPLYDHVVDFLAKRGVEARVANKSKQVGEVGPTD